MVKANDGVLIVEVDTPDNGHLSFRPLPGRKVRGRVDFHRCNGDTGKLVREWPDGIPSQQLGVDLAAGEGFILELLHDDPVPREKAERIGKLAPQRESFAGIDVATWLYWIRSAVEAGIAHVVQGAVPEKIEGARKEFITRRQPDPTERLAVALEGLLEELRKRA